MSKNPSFIRTSCDPPKRAGKPLGIGNPSFAIDKLAQDCGPLQYLRELTQNSLEAVDALGGGGQVVWDIDEWTTPARQCPGKKLSIYDTGTGMTAEQLHAHISRLFASGRVQAVDGNYGIGAKIAALPGNPLGLVYTTLTSAGCYRLTIERRGEEWQVAVDESGAEVVAVDPTELPPEIQKAGQGTLVTLLGDSPEQDTTERPAAAVGGQTAWLVRWLNGRYFTFPTSVSVRARRTDGADQTLLALSGQKARLAVSAEKSGTLRLHHHAVKAHWWILRDGASKTAGAYANLYGHTGLLYDNELYEVPAAGSAALSRLGHCGVPFGGARVVIYFEPVDDMYLETTTDTARTRLRYRQDDFPWEDVAGDFAEHLPNALAAFVNEHRPKASTEDLLKRMQEALSEMFERLGMQPYQMTPSGGTTATPDPGVPGGSSTQAGGSAEGDGPSGGDGGTSGDRGGLEGTDAPARRARPQIPDVFWCHESDPNWPDDLADRAAYYEARSNTLLVNRDFRGFTSLAAHWEGVYKKEPHRAAAVWPALQDAVSFALAEAICSTRYFKKGESVWTAEDRAQLVSPAALTLVSMQRYRFEQAIQTACKAVRRQASRTK